MNFIEGATLIPDLQGMLKPKIIPLLRIENTNNEALCGKQSLGNFDESDNNLAIHNCILGSLCHQIPFEVQ